MRSEELEKIIIRQQKDLTRLEILRAEYSETIKTQDAEITRLLRMVEDYERQIAERNEFIRQIAGEQSAAYKADASKRGERLE